MNEAETRAIRRIYEESTETLWFSVGKRRMFLSSTKDNWKGATRGT